MIFVDTSAWYAFLSADDRDHGAVRAAFQESLASARVFECTSYVLAETMGLVQRRLGSRVLRRFVDDVLPLAHVRWVGRAEHDAAWELMREVGKRSFTIVDASTAALMRRAGARRVIALDPEFRRLGFETIPG